MALSLYDASVPAYTQLLTALSRSLDKAAAFCAARKFDEGLLLAARLYPDMFPLSRQVQVATDNAKGPAARLAGMEVPKFDDNEKTIAELKARLAKTVDFVNGIDRKAFDGAEGRDVTWPAGGATRTLRGDQYLFTHALPNFYFHLTAAYAIMRANGVEIGKIDFLRGQPAN